MRQWSEKGGAKAGRRRKMRGMNFRQILFQEIIFERKPDTV